MSFGLSSTNVSKELLFNCSLVVKMMFLVQGAESGRIESKEQGVENG
ncbi:hypothetical protein [Pseudopedobacter saltans]|nr:hypothetical protein [Pseudopedobacter saltans]